MPCATVHNKQLRRSVQVHPQASGAKALQHCPQRHLQAQNRGPGLQAFCAEHHQAPSCSTRWPGGAVHHLYKGKGPKSWDINSRSFYLSEGVPHKQRAESFEGGSCFSAIAASDRLQLPSKFLGE